MQSLSVMTRWVHTFDSFSEIIDKEFVMSNPKDFSVVKKIDGLLDDPSSLDEKKQKNLRISQKFSIEKNCEKTLELINRHFND